MMGEGQARQGKGGEKARQGPRTDQGKKTRTADEGPRQEPRTTNQTDDRTGQVKIKTRQGKTTQHKAAITILDG
jgi:hypothetical protein